MTLLMRDQENREIGRAEGIVEGIQALISTLRELDTSDMVILQKLREKFNLTEKEARNYLGLKSGRAFDSVLCLILYVLFIWEMIVKAS